MSTILGNNLFMDMLTHHELAMQKMYGMFSEQFGGSEFWSELSKDENRHAAMTIRLTDGFKKGYVLLPEMRVKVSDVKLALDSINTKITSWKKWGIKQEDAFEFALLQEDNPVENLFGMAFKIEEPELRDSFYDVAHAHRHADQIREAKTKASRSVFNLFGLFKSG